jgi:formyl-CoA transferase
MLPLEGLLVVSIEQAVAAPACTLRLADLGAHTDAVQQNSRNARREHDIVILRALPSGISLEQRAF